MGGGPLTIMFGILVSTTSAVIFLRAVLLRECSIRLLWPSLLLVWLFVGSLLLIAVGSRLLPPDSVLVTSVERYPGLMLVLALLAGAIGGWICRPIRHIFAERLPER